MCANFKPLRNYPPGSVRHCDHNGYVTFWLNCDGGEVEILEIDGPSPDKVDKLLEQAVGCRGELCG